MENAAEGLRWYRKTTQLDPDNQEGWLGLGELAHATSTLEEAETAEALKVFWTARDIHGKRLSHNPYAPLAPLRFKRFRALIKADELCWWAQPNRWAQPIHGD